MLVGISGTILRKRIVKFQVVKMYFNKIKEFF